MNREIHHNHRNAPIFPQNNATTEARNVHLSLHKFCTANRKKKKRKLFNTLLLDSKSFIDIGIIKQICIISICSGIIEESLT